MGPPRQHLCEIITQAIECLWEFVALRHVLSICVLHEVYMLIMALGESFAWFSTKAMQKWGTCRHGIHSSLASHRSRWTLQQKGTTPGLPPAKELPSVYSCSCKHYLTVGMVLRYTVICFGEGCSFAILCETTRGGLVVIERDCFFLSNCQITEFLATVMNCLEKVLIQEMKLHIDIRGWSPSTKNKHFTTKALPCEIQISWSRSLARSLRRHFLCQHAHPAW